MKTKRFLLAVVMLLFVFSLSACSSKSLKEKTVLDVIDNKVSEGIPETYYLSILDDLRVSKDTGDVYSKKIGENILSYAQFSVNKISGRSATITVRTKDIYSYLNKDTFLTEYLIKSNDFMKNNISNNEYNELLVEFLNSKLNSNNVNYKSIKVTIDFTYNENKSSWELSDDSYALLLNTILCRSEDIEASILKKMEPLGFTELEFAIIPSSTIENSNLNNPRDKAYDKTNEKTLKDNMYMIPNDIEYQSIPSSNDTTRTSRRSPIKRGDVAVFDGIGLGNPKANYKVNILINEALFGNNAKSFLSLNDEDIDLDKEYAVFSISIKLVENKTEYDTISFSFTDFDLINYDDVSYDFFVLKNVSGFDKIKAKESTTGYIAFVYDGNSNINLAFKEFLPNTLWFEIN